MNSENFSVDARVDFYMDYTHVDAGTIYFETELPRRIFADGRKMRGFYTSLFSEGYDKARTNLANYRKEVLAEPEIEVSENFSQRDRERRLELYERFQDDTTQVKIEFSMSVSSTELADDEVYAELSYWDRRLYFSGSIREEIKLPFYALFSSATTPLIKEVISYAFGAAMENYEQRIKDEWGERMERLDRKLEELRELEAEKAEVE